MKRSLLTTVLLVSSCIGPGCAAGQEPEEIIEKAVRAAGGEENLTKLKAIRTKAKGTLNIGTDVPFIWETTWQWPKQYKMVAELDAAGNKVTLIQGFDGQHGWGGTTSATAAVDGKKLDELRAQMHLRRVLMLIPLLKSKTYELTTLDETKVDGKPSSRVKVSMTGQRDVTLCFDKTTGLLAKIEHDVLDHATMKEVAQEDSLSDYQEIDGVKTAMKEVWFRSGVKIAELNYTDVSYSGAIVASEFARPAGGLPADLPVTRSANEIYGRKFGMALTMDVFTPNTGANGAAIILVVSGGWVSDSEALNSQLIGNFVAEPVKRGYTVFAVFHGSQPKYTIPEAIADLNRAVRYIRHHATDYQIDPERIGITGGSAGGHLSLIQGTAGDLGNDKAADVVERESSRVQAVACLFPPTDFLNYGGDGRYAFAEDGVLAAFRPAVDVRELDSKTLRLERLNEEKQGDLAAKISPISHVSADDPPTLIIHGDADKLVPIQQAEAIVKKMSEVGARAELITRKGRGHDFAGIDKDISAMTDWFDEHLNKK